MVPWVPEPEARRRMSAVPLAGVPAMPGFYWAKGYTASSILALFTLVLISLIVAVWPFRRPMAKMMTEQETAGRDIRDRKLRDAPRGIAVWLICVLVVQDSWDARNVRRAALSRAKERITFFKRCDSKTGSSTGGRPAPWAMLLWTTPGRSANGRPYAATTWSVASPPSHPALKTRCTLPQLPLGTTYFSRYALRSPSIENP